MIKIKPCTVAALIINWNGAQDTIELLCSLEESLSTEIKMTVAIIDNASEEYDRALLEDFIQKWSGRIQLIYRANGVNIGVPGAYNQAIQIIGTEFDCYLRLDNDVVVTSDGLTSLIDAWNKKRVDNFGIIGGNIKYYDRPDLDNGGAVRIDLIKGRTYVSYPSHDTVCDGVLGCIMLIDGDLVRKYAPNVFDSRLFLCTDESELSLRARFAGVNTWYVARTIGLHKSGRSTKKVAYTSNYYSARNWALLRLKYTRGFFHKSLVVYSLIWGTLKSIFLGRFAYPIGTLSGAFLFFSEVIDKHAHPRGTRSHKK